MNVQERSWEKLEKAVIAIQTAQAINTSLGMRTIAYSPLILSVYSSSFIFLKFVIYSFNWYRYHTLFSTDYLSTPTFLGCRHGNRNNKSRKSHSAYLLTFCIADCNNFLWDLLSEFPFFYIPQGLQDFNS